MRGPDRHVHRAGDGLGPLARHSHIMLERAPDMGSIRKIYRHHYRVFGKALQSGSVPFLLTLSLYTCLRLDA